jgi:hypothetical protein
VSQKQWETAAETAPILKQHSSNWRIKQF